MIISAWGVYGYLIEQLSSVTMSFLLAVIFRRNSIWNIGYNFKDFLRRRIFNVAIWRKGV